MKVNIVARSLPGMNNVRSKYVFKIVIEARIVFELERVI